MELITLRSRQRAEELRFILQGGGIRSSMRRFTSDELEPLRWSVLVPRRNLEQAREILSEEGFLKEHEKTTRAAEPTAAVKRPGLHWIVGLVLVNLAVWIAQEGHGGSESRRALLRFGASHAPSLSAGQWWRTISAVFLHIGARHLIANMFSLAVLGPAVLGTWGAGRFYFIYLASGVAGNWISFALSPTRSVKAGASGAILGLLGALAGNRIHQIRTAEEPSRYRTWHVLAMLLAFYGFVIGAGGTVDHLAHLGGLLAGGLLAVIIPPRGHAPGRTDRLLGAVAGAAATLAASAAGLLAYSAGIVP